MLLRSLLFLVSATLAAQGFNGYYRYPDVHGDKIVFTAEGDLWLVSTEGGLAQRLTSHPEEETHAVFSPDGATIAFSASYEGPTEVYTMPATGGLPTRWTYVGNATWMDGNDIIQFQEGNWIIDQVSGYYILEPLSDPAHKN